MRFIALFTLIPATAFAGFFEASFPEESEWIGPDFWANPLYAWKAEKGTAVVEAGKGTNLHLLSHQIKHAKARFVIETTVKFDEPASPGDATKTWAGVTFGIKGKIDDYRHALVSGEPGIHAGVRADGHLFIGDKISKEKVDTKESVSLLFEYSLRGILYLLDTNNQEVSVFAPVPADKVEGNLALAAESPGKRIDKQSPAKVRFEEWSGYGNALIGNPEQAFGPILWSQYTLSNDTLKLSVQMAPVSGVVILDRRVGNGWKSTASAEIDPLSRTAAFRGESWDIFNDTGYRIRYDWEGRMFTWEGTVRKDPFQKNEFKIAAFSCDHGYAFPQPKLVRNVLEQDPDMVFFAGDQIYEGYGGFGTIRKPVDLAALDYLRKWYQFGWTWREILKDRPSIIIPDDHDVFQGNIWGHGGRPLPEGKGLDGGGYRMHPDWVNAVQRTQTSHLPDSPDPNPVEQGIGVYFTYLHYAGIPFAVLEDRKFKSGPAAVLPQKPRNLTPEELDVEGAELLGERQEAFLETFAKATPLAPVRFIFSQTIFCKGHTHSGRQLKESHYDLDTNGWPRSGRDRALRLLTNSPRTIMLHGDQHYGLLVRHGIDAHNDGPYAFMVPGSANGFPRAWWPKGPSAPPETWPGDFTDPFGNKFTVLAAGNPEAGSNTMNPRGDDHPETTAHRKGSGHGLVVFDRARKTATFNLYRYDFDAANPMDTDQFPGFPRTIELK